jgi:photosystem II stability/assembly factor-like uncharacterized protein
VKKIIFTLLLLQFLFTIAQKESNLFTYRGKLNFNLIKAAADEHFKGIELVKANPADPFEEDNNYLKYKRWENYWKGRVLEDGSFPDLRQQANTYKALQNNSLLKSSYNVSNWVNISQTSATGGYNGMGRLNCVAFHPTNANIFWVGAPFGGIWKTIDGGQSYSPLGDNLPLCSVNNILVNSINPNIIYINISDNFEFVHTGSCGLYKTTDGGLTWSPTSLSSATPVASKILDMAMAPTNPNVIFVTKENVVYRSDDGGNNFTAMVLGTNGFFGSFYQQVKFKPNDNSTLYISKIDFFGTSELFKSTDGGITFIDITPGTTFPSGRISLATTAANPSILGVILRNNNTASQQYFESSNSGVSFNLKSSIPLYSPCFNISQTNPSKIYACNVNVNQSTDAGLTWVTITNWYNTPGLPEVHADQRYIATNPLNGYMYFCNDGGLYRYDEVANTWTELNNTLAITQFYSIALSSTDPVFMMGGTQDNGGRKRTALNVWSATNGGDAMNTAIDQTNDQVIYSSYANGQLLRSDNQWLYSYSYSFITPTGVTGDWETPFILDPNNQSTIYAGYQDVYKSIDKGTTWTTISTNLTGFSWAKLEELEVSPVNSNIIYASRSYGLYTTINGGLTWSLTYLPISANNNKITSITADPYNANVLYLTYNGYMQNDKVFKSIDGGATFTNITGNLPNVPVSTCVINKASPTREIYVGTDVGVFYINNLNSTWTYFGNNLPNAPVTDLEIQYATGKLRAATFGRGIWETDLFINTSSIDKVNANRNRNRFSNAYNPSKDIMFINANIVKDSDAKLNFYSTTGRLCLSIPKHFQQGNYQIPIDISKLDKGGYFVNIETNGEVERYKLVKE